MSLQLPKQTELVVFNTGTLSHKPHWFAMVRNTANGQKWVQNFRNKNRHLTVKVFNRHSDRRLAFELMGKDYDTSYAAHNITKKFAERFAVYVEKNNRRNKNVKIDEHMTIGENYFNVHKVWSEKGNKHLTAFSRFVGYVTLRWSDKKGMWA